MKPNLSQHQRILVSLIYLGILILIFNSIGGKVTGFVIGPNPDSAIWFSTGALMIILGSYVIEPFFTKPSDAIANSTAVLISLLGLTDKNSFLEYKYIFFFSVFILFLSILTIFLK